LVPKYKITHTQLVPTMFVRFLSCPTRCASGTTCHRCAAPSMPPRPARSRPRRRSRLVGADRWEYYGGTEGNGLTMCNASERLAHRGTVGAPCWHGQDLRRRRQRAAAGEAGTIYLPTADRSNTTTSPEDGRDQERPWLDHARRPGLRRCRQLPDLTDRKAFMIISGGVNITRREARTLITHPR